jgi:hypothetical protein
MNAYEGKGMKYKPCPAFGTIVILVNATAGCTREVVIADNGLVTSGYYYYTDGVAKVKVVETDEELEDRTPGWLNVEHAGAHASSNGHLELTFPVDTEWLCIPHVYNKRNGLPNLSSIIIESGQSLELKQGSNFFLVRGQIEINTKEFTGPTQIRIRSGDALATSTYSNTSYGLLFL